jgi:hypothetical protein
MGNMHTKGPWKYVAGTLKHYVHSENGDFGISIQELHPEDGRLVPAAENARLISAAPDLLEACEAVIGVVDCLGEGRAIVLGKKPLDAMRAAMAKAKGES